jgi:hypothetical protein
VFLAVSAVTAQAQEAQPASLMTVPVASRSQSDCTGFIAESAIPRDLFVVGGADDDFHSVVRQFTEGDSIFISPRKGGDIAVGAEYSVVRRAKELFATMHYSGQGWDLRKLGKPYEDIAQVKVTHVNPQGAVATVVFSCESIVPGDALVPFQPRPIPEYTVSSPLDHFVPLDKDKKGGRITASHNNFGFLGQENVVYLNLGDQDGAKPGQRYRIYKALPPHSTGFLTAQATPPEIVGEAVVLTVHSKSCVAMIVSSYREIMTGDYVEAE